MSKSFKQLLTPLPPVQAQTQLQQEMTFSTQHASQYQEQVQPQLPFTSQSFNHFNDDIEQDYLEGEEVTLKRPVQRKSPITPFPAIPATLTLGTDGSLMSPIPATPGTDQAVVQFPDISTTPATTIPVSLAVVMRDVDLRIRKDVERYVKWLHRNNSLPISQQKLQAYQTESMQMKKVGKREVRTFAPFQERTSALKVITSKQLIIIAALLLCWCVGLFFLHTAMFAFTLGFITLLYISGFIISSVLATRSLNGESGEKIDENIIHTLDQIGVEWPSYTILCPLYKETAIAPQFVRAMKALDYPEEKLQVLFLTEENDNETRAALYNLQLPAGFTVLTVPKGSPQTKPRACNFGLLQAKGQFVVIFDAEDKPEPYQLKKAVLTFANHGPEVACVQAKLNYYNANQNLLTRWFTAEYSTWFDIMLPGLQRIGFSLPLGGTSNHFRTEVLHALGGWDAFNVTEDCDLGLRIAQYNLKTMVLDSTTYEEAASRPKVWLYQRSRWIKGYFQTYLVHMRNPFKMLQKRQFRKFFSLQIIVGAWTSVLLLNPLMWTLTLIYMIFRPVHLYTMLFPGPVLYTGAFCLIFGNFFYVYIHIIGCLRRREYALIKWVLLIPLYWIMMSVSAYIAFYQLIVKPHYWEKTQHGTHLAPLAEARAFTTSIIMEERDLPSSVPTMRIAAVAANGFFGQVAVPSELEPTTQRVTALRNTLTTQLGKRKASNKNQSRVRDLWFFATIVTACLTSIIATWYYFEHHEILLYDDAYSHLRIARMVFDSATPGLSQLGGIWLPLPHILMWAFVWNDSLWRTGLAGSFVGMLCYLATTIYLYLSIKRLTHNSAVSFLGSLAFIFNPNVLYLQSTPLSELTCFWTLTMASYYFLAWTQEDKNKYLVLAAISTFLATLARYDGWSLFIMLLVFVVVVGIIKKRPLIQIQGNVLLFCLLGGFGIALWLVWNKMIFGDPLFFQHSPYSSQASQMGLEQINGLYAYHNVWLSIKTYTLDMLYSFGQVLTVLAFLAFILFFIRRRFSASMLATLSFVSPFVLYVLSLYSGQAAIWVPGAIPATAAVQLYNVRYGAEMVVPASLFLATLVYEMRFWLRPRFYVFGQILFIGVVIAQSILTTAGGVIAIQDGLSGLSCAAPHAVNTYLAQHYAGGRVLEDVASGDFSLADTGIDFKDLVYDGSGSLWYNALNNPADTVQWIITWPGNSVAKNINNSALHSQFDLIVQESGGLSLYHRKGEPPLPTRPLPYEIFTIHQMCSVGNH